MVPETALDDRVFVIADMMAQYEILRGDPAITFNGAVEWALDYVLTYDAIWMLTEGQTRTKLQQALGENAQFILRLTQTHYECELALSEAPLVFSAATAADAYGQALLALLRQAAT
ncbi:MAG: hypothetical protein ACPG8W_14580 [Candidatus Promineifilaceae bacterium]